MDDRLALIGFRHSVYTRIVRIALIETGLQADYIEVDPFEDFDSCSRAAKGQRQIAGGNGERTCHRLQMA